MNLVECKELKSTNVNNKVVLSMLISTMKTHLINQESIDTNTFIIVCPKHHDTLFLDYLTTPSVLKIYRIEGLEDRRMMILKEFWKETFVAYRGTILAFS